MTEWALQDARNHFSAVVDAALTGSPQRITQRGKPTVVVVAIEEYERLQHLEHTERTLRYLPLDRLIPSRENARKTLAEDTAFEQLKKSIAAHGLLDNFLVCPTEQDDSCEGRYEVVAGARRLAALQALAGEGSVAHDHPVACNVLPTNSPAAELSLVENTIRAALHPADQAEAFAKLAHAGATVSEIAARFGISERTTERWLRLGNAAPVLLDAYRAGKIGLQSLQAFCLTPDTQLQIAVWEELKPQYDNTSVLQIKRLVTEGMTPDWARIARFVGVAAYEAAGGTLTRDVFVDGDDPGIWLDDPALLRKLALDRLEIVAEELRYKWSWAEARLDFKRYDVAQFAHISPQPGEITEDEAKEYDQLIVRRDELVEIDDGDWTEDTESELERVETRLEEIGQAEIDRAVFRRKDMEVGGVIVTINDDGTLWVIQGLLRPEDLAAAGAVGLQHVDVPHKIAHLPSSPSPENRFAPGGH